jgi:tetratricopeptide (TPR) repeat protein
MDSAGAIRSMGEDVAKFNADVDRYFAAGVYQAVQAPNRSLNPDRDFVTAVLTADDFQLARADFLGPGADAIYVALLKDGKHRAEANEGLGFLALRAGDEDKAAGYFAEAYTGGSRNVLALTAYGKAEKHYDVAIEVLQKALTIDPKYAPAHWELGDKYDDPKQRLAEWKIALGLEPRNVDWWVRYAHLSEGQKQWAEAGRAWASAAQATPDPAKRDEYLKARGMIEQQRLDDEAAEKRRDEAAKAAEIERLKSQARKELASAEARANSQNPKKNDNAAVVDWWDAANSSTLNGTLTRVDCVGKQLKLQVKETGGTVRVMLIADPNGIDVKGGEMKFSCGVQKARTVVIHYKPATDSTAGVYGEVVGIEYK